MLTLQRSPHTYTLLARHALALSIKASPLAGSSLNMVGYIAQHTENPVVLRQRLEGMLRLCLAAKHATSSCRTAVQASAKHQHTPVVYARRDMCMLVHDTIQCPTPSPHCFSSMLLQQSSVPHLAASHLPVQQHPTSASLCSVI